MLYYAEPGDVSSHPFMLTVRLLFVSGCFLSFTAAVQLSLTARQKMDSFGVALDDHNDLLYFCKVKLGGNQFSVLVDTGR
jgi:hypothetical protein